MNNMTCVHWLKPWPCTAALYVNVLIIWITVMSICTQHFCCLSGCELEFVVYIFTLNILSLPCSPRTILNSCNYKHIQSLPNCPTRSTVHFFSLSGYGGEGTPRQDKYSLMYISRGRLVALIDALPQGRATEMWNTSVCSRKAQGPLRKICALKLDILLYPPEARYMKESQPNLRIHTSEESRGAHEIFLLFSCIQIDTNIKQLSRGSVMFCGACCPVRDGGIICDGFADRLWCHGVIPNIVIKCGTRGTVLKFKSSVSLMHSRRAEPDLLQKSMF